MRHEALLSRQVGSAGPAARTRPAVANGMPAFRGADLGARRSFPTGGRHRPRCCPSRAATASSRRRSDAQASRSFRDRSRTPSHDGHWLQPGGTSRAPSPSMAARRRNRIRKTISPPAQASPSEPVAILSARSSRSPRIGQATLTSRVDGPVTERWGTLTTVNDRRSEMRPRPGFVARSVSWADSRDHCTGSTSQPQLVESIEEVVGAQEGERRART